MSQSSQKVWFCIDTRLTSPSAPAMYSIIYAILPGYSTGFRPHKRIRYISLNHIGQSHTLKDLIRKYEAGLDLNIRYREKRETVPELHLYNTKQLNNWLSE